MWQLIVATFAAVAVGAVVVICRRKPYPGRRPGPYPPPLAVPVLSPDGLATQTRALIDIALPHTDPNSVWDQAVIGGVTPLRTALDDFAAGTTGASVRNLDLALYAGNPEELHNYLVDNGFRHQREALKQELDATTQPPTQMYWKTNGGTTSNPRDPDVVPHDIYTHADGGIVRVKPEGIPDPTSPRPQPHAVKAVLYQPHQDNGFDDEAFKVTNAGQAVPKIFSPRAGMRQAHPNLSKTQVKKTYMDTVMRQAHTDI